MSETPIREIIRNNIEQLTIKTKTSNRKLSENIDTSSNYIQKVVEGRYTPTPEKLMDIANYFKLPIGYLFRENPGPIDEITDYLVELDDKSLNLVLTLVKQLHQDTHEPQNAKKERTTSQ